MSKPHSESHPIAIGKLLEHPRLAVLALRKDALKRLAREEAQRQREGNFPVGDNLEGGVERIVSEVEKISQSGYPRALNGTGILLHTGLGRSPLADAAIDAMQEAARSCVLEIDRESGERGNRWQEVERKLCLLTGAEAALVVNNCAAAVLLMLSSLAEKKEAIVSRGEQVEIGGGFRMPDVMKRSGVKRVEVGTTNRTRIEDYRAAITPKTAALLKVHPSNYRIIGFTESATLDELVLLGRESAIPVIEDLGNGLLIDLADYGLPHEPTIEESIRAGVDLLSVSGDKCLGGPQCGIILGKQSLVQKCKINALTRAVRPDKITLAALDRTLGLWLTGREREIPFIQMLSQSQIALRARAELILSEITRTPSDRFEWSIQNDSGAIGSGSVPQTPIPDVAICLTSKSVKIQTIAKSFRNLHIPIFSVLSDGIIRIHLRSILPAEDCLLSEMLLTLS